MNKKLFLLLLSVFFCVNAAALPIGFVYLKDVDPSIQQDMRYKTSNNFLGRPVTGYQAGICILTHKAALALKTVQQQLKKQNLSLKVYDCYRPQMAVNDFVHWSHDPADQRMKKTYYPNINKRDLFKKGYISARSGHTRGSTVDLTLAQQDGKALDMGTHFDFADKSSHPAYGRLHKNVLAHRALLRHVMQQAGFEPLVTEWWHFTLRKEPFPETYFNFVVR